MKVKIQNFRIGMQGVADLIEHDAQSASLLAAQSGFTGSATVTEGVKLQIERHEANTNNDMRIAER